MNKNKNSWSAYLLKEGGKGEEGTDWHEISLHTPWDHVGISHVIKQNSAQPKQKNVNPQIIYNIKQWT